MDKVVTVDSTSDDRTVNNVMRHAYRVLSDEEKATMQKIKDDGLAFDALSDEHALKLLHQIFEDRFGECDDASEAMSEATKNNFSALGIAVDD